MTLVIDIPRALREPEYRDEISDELEGDITETMMLEAADEIDRLRAGPKLADVAFLISQLDTIEHMQDRDAIARIAKRHGVRRVFE